MSTHGPRACAVTAAHDGGYGATFAFALGVEAAGGEVVAAIPAPFELDGDGAAAMVDTAIGYGVDVVMIAASGDARPMFHAALAGRSVPTVSRAPYSYGPDGPDGLLHTAVSTWNPTAPARASFIDGFTAATGRPAHVYALLAHEAGLALADATAGAAATERRGAALAERLRSATIDGPRGPARFSSGGQDIVTPQFLLRPTGDGIVAEPLDPPDLLEEQVALARRKLDKTGWSNPYLIA